MNWVSNRFRIHRMRMRMRRRFESIEEVEWETEGYFGGFDKSHYLKGIENLENQKHFPCSVS